MADTDTALNTLVTGVVVLAVADRLLDNDHHHSKKKSKPLSQHKF